MPDALPTADAAGLEFWRPPEGLLPPNAWFGLPTRRGGVSVGAFASLNLGLEVEGEARDAVMENRRRVLAALGIPPAGPVRIRQVHGVRVVEPSAGSAEADGFRVRAGDPWVAVTAADCAPVAIVTRDGRAGALLHSGWRGARSRIGAHAVEALASLGHAPGSLRASIGPCLHRCCFPVGPEVASQFPARVLAPHASGRAALDLPAAIRDALLEAGVLPADIAIASECTSCLADAFYSHRRDRGVTGRHWALLHLAPVPRA